MPDTESKVPWWFLFLADSLLNMLVFAPLVVGYWRGTWTLLGIYLYPSQPNKNAWTCVGVGNAGSLMLALFQVFFKKHFPLTNKLVWLFVCHLYTYVAALFAVCSWKGLWNGIDIYTGMSDDSYIVSLSLGVSILWLLRAASMIVACPGMCAQDTNPEFFTWSSRFQQRQGCTENYFLDHFLTVVVIWNSVVMCWRGVWGLADNHFYPDNLEYSAWCSLAVGYGLNLLCLPLQLIGNIFFRFTLLHGYSKIYRVLLEDFLFILANIGAINVWRGLWLTYDMYILPEQQVVSCWITHVLGIGLLMILLAGNSVLARGCHVTGESEPNEGCYLPNNYLRYYFGWQECSDAILDRKASHISLTSSYDSIAKDGNDDDDDIMGEGSKTLGRQLDDQSTQDQLLHNSDDNNLMRDRVL